VSAGRGRPIVSDDARLHIYNIRLTHAQIEKLARLGGAAWIRQKIDRAKIVVDSEKPAVVVSARKTT
jgi:hypothetical protein